MAPELGKVRENITKMSQLVKQAKDGGAHLIVLPELATCGYSHMSSEEAGQYAEIIEPPQKPFDGNRSVHVMSLLARRWNVHIIWGLMELDPLSGRLYNSQAYVDPDGNLTSYRKVNLYSTDYLWASEGESRPPIVQTTIDGRSFRIGLLVCRDVRDQRGKEEVHFYEPGDCDICCLSANWGRGGFPAQAWVDFVQDNRCTLAVSNRYGSETPNDFGDGGVCVMYPTGRVHCKGLEWGKDCVVFAEV